MFSAEINGVQSPKEQRVSMKPFLEIKKKKNVSTSIV